MHTYTVKGGLTDDESATTPYFAFGNQYTLSFTYDTSATATYSFGGMNATYSLTSVEMNIKAGANTLTVSSSNSLNKVIIRNETSYHGYDFHVSFPAYLNFTGGQATAKIQGSLGFGSQGLTLPLDELVNINNSLSSTTIFGHAAILGNDRYPRFHQ